MKKIYFLLLLLLPYFVKAQSFSYTSSTGLNMSGPDSVNLIAHIDIFNMTSYQLEVMCKVSSMNLAPGHAKYFCFGAFCYDTSAVVSLMPITTKPGKKDSLQAYLTPNRIPGSDEITYQIYDDSGIVNDTLSLTIHYNFYAVRVPELNSPSYTLGMAGPNPANNLTGITYSFSSGKDVRLVFYNLLGSALKEVKLKDRQGVALIETSQFNSGIYIYSLVIDGTPVSSKKLVVTHR